MYNFEIGDGVFKIKSNEDIVRGHSVNVTLLTSLSSITISIGAIQGITIKYSEIGTINNESKGVDIQSITKQLLDLISGNTSRQAFGRLLIEENSFLLIDNNAKIIL